MAKKVLSKKAREEQNFLQKIIIIVGVILIAGVISVNVQADQITHKFKSPSFNGINTSSHYLTIENQEFTRKAQIQKDVQAALDKANTQLFYAGHNTTNVKFGYFDSPNVSDVQAEKMSLQYCRDVILWILEQPYRIKSITVTP